MASAAPRLVASSRVLPAAVAPRAATFSLLSSPRRCPYSQPCGCCGLKTAADKQLDTWLQTEIKNERAQLEVQLPPSLHGFSVLASGNDLSLTKQASGEQIRIVWSVGLAGMEYDDEDYDGHGDEPPAPVPSPPNLLVMITKHSSTLVVHCTPYELQEHEQGEEDSGAVEIIDAALVPSADAEGDYVDVEQRLVKAYKVAGNDMDPDMYGHLVQSLQERGIDKQLVDDLLEMHGSYEHSQYVQFLERLQQFNRK